MKKQWYTYTFYINYFLFSTSIYFGAFGGNWGITDYMVSPFHVMALNVKNKDCL